MLTAEPTGTCAICKDPKGYWVRYSCCVAHEFWEGWLCKACFAKAKAFEIDVTAIPSLTSTRTGIDFYV